MPHARNRTQRLTLAAAALFLLAGVLHESDSLLPPPFQAYAFLTVSVIYIGLIIAWAISIRQRIMDASVRELLFATSMLGVVWMLQRTCKYRFFTELHITQILWYLSYLQQIFAPLLAFLAALCLGRAQDAPLPRRWYLLLIPASLMFLGVMSNDLHQLAFRFPQPRLHEADSYTHGPLYFLIVAWGMGLTAASMALLFRKCRVANSRRYIWLPGAVFAAGFAASLLSLFHILSAYKVPELLCATFIATWECCIRLGLVPSNANYASYFSASTISAQIVDSNDVIAYQSATSLSLTREQRRRAQDGAVFLDADTRLHCHPVRGGRVYWTDDVAQINRIRRRLAEVGELLAEDNELMRAENEARRQQAQLEEQNRLYDGMLPTVRPQLCRISALLDGLEPDAPDFDRRIALSCVYGAYVKRRCNLALLPEGTPAVPLQELALCIRESLGCLPAIRAAAALRVQGDAPQSPDAILLAYDFFEAAVESALPSLSALLVNLRGDPDGLTLRMTMEDVRAPLSQDWEAARLRQLHAALRTEQQDGTLFLTLRIDKAGDRA